MGNCSGNSSATGRPSRQAVGRSEQRRLSDILHPGTRCHVFFLLLLPAPAPLPSLGTSFPRRSAHPPRAVPGDLSAPPIASLLGAAGGSLHAGRGVVPTWAALGPAPQSDSSGFLAGPNESVSGRVTSLALLNHTLYVGSASGGF